MSNAPETKHGGMKSIRLRLNPLGRMIVNKIIPGFEYAHCNLVSKEVSVEMAIIITPLAINSDDEFKLSLFWNEKKEEYRQTVYWGVYLNDELISYTSSKQLAEKTKLWMENWLERKT